MRFTCSVFEFDNICCCVLSSDIGDNLIVLQILYKNVAHPKLAAYLKNHNWLIESGEYLMFPQNQSEFKGGVVYYLESIEEVGIFLLSDLNESLWIFSTLLGSRLLYMIQTVS